MGNYICCEGAAGFAVEGAAASAVEWAAACAVKWAGASAVEQAAASAVEWAAASVIWVVASAAGFDACVAWAGDYKIVLVDFVLLFLLAQMSKFGNHQMTRWRDSSVLNAASHNMQLCGHSGTSG